MARQERKKDKAERRKSRKEERARRPERSDEVEDPDIAHIVWGPQPDADEDEESDDAESDDVNRAARSR